MISKYSPAILSGFLIGTSYIPFPPWAIFFCLIPLWTFWLKNISLKEIFIAGWITQFVLNMIGFHWIAYTTVVFGQMPYIGGFAVLLLFSSVAHLYYPIAGVIWKWLSNQFKLSTTASVLLIPLVLILCERLYPFLFYWHFGYPWLWTRLPGFQLAEWIGFFGLNLITLITNALFMLFWLERKKGQWAQRWSIGAVALVLIVNILGLLVGLNLTPTDKTFRATIVQGNIGNQQKMQAEKGNSHLEATVNTYMNLTRAELERTSDVDAVFWPETAFPEVVYDNFSGPQRKRMNALSSQFQTPIISGAYQRRGPKRKIHNAFVMFDGPEILGAYQKTHLLAYGEYFPMAETFPVLYDWFPQVSDFGRGKGPTALQFKNTKLGVQICYEGLFDEFSTDLQKKNAQIFVNLTNDSWFGWPFEPYQHMYMTLARAVENRRPLIRVTNTGISTVILGDGTVLEQSPHHQEWAKTYDIPYHSIPQKTFYVNLSRNWWWILILMIALLIAGDRIARTGKH